MLGTTLNGKCKRPVEINDNEESRKAVEAWDQNYQKARSDLILSNNSSFGTLPNKRVGTSFYCYNVACNMAIVRYIPVKSSRTKGDDLKAIIIYKNERKLKYSRLFAQIYGNCGQTS